MADVFPEPITNLPEADIPLDGIKAYLSQAENKMDDEFGVSGLSAL